VNLKSYNQSENLYPDSESLSSLNATRCYKTLISTGGPVNNSYTIITISDNSGAQYIYEGASSVAAGDTVTQSWYVRDIDSINIISLRFWTGTGRAWTTQRQVDYTLSSSTMVDYSGVIVDKQLKYIGDGWYRLSLTAVTDQAGTAIMSIIWTTPLAIGKRLYVSGPQLTKKTGLTAYTPTTGSIITQSTTVSDISNNNNTATIVNSPVYNSSGYFSYDYTKSQQLTFANNPNLQFLGNSPYTLEAWIYPTRNPGASNYTGIFDRESNPGSGRDGYNLYFLGGTAGATTQITAERFSAGTASATWITLYESVSVNAWHHIVATYDGSLLRIYRNGSYVSTSSESTGAITNTVKTLTIGVRGGNRFDGRIGVTNIYNRALSAADIVQSFNALRGRYGL
jgi:hypothetical protein